MTKIILFFFWWFISYFFYFVFRLFWHISQKKRITIEIIEFIFSVYFDLFIKKNALRSKSLFFQLFWKFFLRQKSYLDNLFQISFILFHFILTHFSKKMFYDRTSNHSNFDSFSTFLIFDFQFILIRKRITIEIIDERKSFKVYSIRSL